MAIQVLTRAEVEEVSGAAITVDGPGLSASVDPFALANALFTNTLTLISSALTGVLGLAAGLPGILTGLLGGLSLSLSASASVSASASASAD